MGKIDFCKAPIQQTNTLLAKYSKLLKETGELCVGLCYQLFRVSKKTLELF